MNNLLKKAERFWYLHKLKIIIIAVAAFLAGYFAYHLLKPAEKIAVEVMFVNFYDNVSENSEFSRDFVSFAGLEDSEEKVIFDNNAFFNLSKSSDYANSYYQKTITYLDTKTIDAVVCQYDNLMGIADGGRFIDLSDARTGSIFEKYRDRIVTIEKEGVEIPVGIDVTDSPVWENMNGYADRCYVGISSCTERFDMVSCFLDYLLDSSYGQKEEGEVR